MSNLLEGLSDCLLEDLSQCRIWQTARVWHIDAPNREIANCIIKQRWEWHDRPYLQLSISINGEHYTQLNGERMAARYERRKARLFTNFSLTCSDRPKE